MSVRRASKNITIKIVFFLPSPVCFVVFFSSFARPDWSIHQMNRNSQSNSILNLVPLFFPYVNPREPTQEKGGGFLTRRDSYIWRYFFKSSNSWCMDSFSSSFSGYFLPSFGVSQCKGEMLNLFWQSFIPLHLCLAVFLVLFCSVYVSYVSYINLVFMFTCLSCCLY